MSSDPSTKAFPTAHAGAQCGSSASHRTSLVHHRSHTGRQPEVCMRVDLQLQLYLQVEVLVPCLARRVLGSALRTTRNKRTTKKTKRRAGLLVMRLLVFLRLTYRRDRPCRCPLKRDSGRYAITLIRSITLLEVPPPQSASSDVTGQTTYR